MPCQQAQKPDGLPAYTCRRTVKTVNGIVAAADATLLVTAGVTVLLLFRCYC